MKFSIMLRIIFLIWLACFVLGVLIYSDPKVREEKNSNYRRKPRFKPHKNNINTTSADLSANNQSASTTTIQHYYPPFEGATSLLKATTIKHIQDFPNSPLGLANAWMVQDPNLSNFSATRKRQRFSLAVQYYATSGANWTNNQNWLSHEVSECQWWQHNSDGNANAVCDRKDGNNNNGHIILTQNLSHNNLQGSLLPEAQLVSLQRLDHSHNQLSGRLRFSSDTMGSLEELVYSYNQLEGLIEAGMVMTSLTNLRVLKLDSNQFVGEIHKGFSLFPDLQVLNLTNNQFGGTVPSEVEFLPQLTYLGLAQNNYFGTVPSEIGLLTQLQELDLSGNMEIRGWLPIELGGAAAENVLKKIDISGTSISGDLPPILCHKQQTGELELVADCSLVNCC